MKKIFLFLILFYCRLTHANCQTAYWQQQVDFNIDVTLNDKEHSLDGFVKMNYFNHSPDTLYYVWFHLWPNAYKNDRTALSDQLLENGRTDFYFSNNDKRGYINRLDFKVNGVGAKMEDHPQHQDIVKIVLPQPLAPNRSANIQTPFHVQLPFNFSRGGHVEQSYQVTQWFPKPAVYDRKGWHSMPYLSQGEFYSEFGNYEVQITLPKNYIVAATGELQDADEKSWLSKQITQPKNCLDCNETKKQLVDRKNITSSGETKTIHFRQNNVHDFAWFADKSFIVYYDTLQLSSGKTIDVYSFHLPKTTEPNYWLNSTRFIKNTITTRSKWLGEYPYNIVSVVEAETGFDGGMEYPTITSVPPVKREADLESVIEHEVGHNWNYGILASNERDHPWMDEGMNTYYDHRYKASESITATREQEGPTFFTRRVPTDLAPLAFATMAANHRDQPIETVSEKYGELNYGLSAYYKAGKWMKMLEQELGTAMFDSCMHVYYREWKFKHPYPEDFKKVMEDVSGKNLDDVFSFLTKKGDLPVASTKKNIRVGSFFNLKDAGKYHNIFIAPLAGFNYYDKLMIGGIVHNYTLPAEKFQFLVAPLYGTGSKQLNGLGDLKFTSTSEYKINKVVAGITVGRFSSKQSLDTFLNKIFENFYKVVPSIQLYFRHEPRSRKISWIDARTFFIGEQTFDNNSIVTMAGGDPTVYPMATTKSNRYINQLSFDFQNLRVLYPYDYKFQLQQGKSFYRVDFTANCFFNYSKSGGAKVRFFASKFGYIGEERSDAYQYQPKLLAANGEQDYTYSNYFIGRTASPSYPEKPVKNLGIGAQQIMIRDGGLKMRFDQYDFLQGRSENWVVAANFSSTLVGIFPEKIPVKIFFDVGTNAEAWSREVSGPNNKFLYVGGLQLSLFKNVLNIYAPLIYNKDFRDVLKSEPAQNTFLKKLTFSIDIQNISLRKLSSKIPF